MFKVLSIVTAVIVFGPAIFFGLYITVLAFLDWRKDLRFRAIREMAKAEPCYNYWIAWEDKRGFRAYSSWAGDNPDDALYTFRCKHPGRRILVCTSSLGVARERINQYPWDNS